MALKCIGDDDVSKNCPYNLQFAPPISAFNELQEIGGRRKILVHMISIREGNGRETQQGIKEVIVRDTCAD